MDRLSTAKMRILNYTEYEMLNKAFEAFDVLRNDMELGSADWPTVKQYIKTLNDVKGDRIHPHSPVDHDNLDHMNLNDIRVRLLNGVRAAYKHMLDEGRITQTTANLLMQSVDEAIDLSADEPLCDWRGVKSCVNIPSYYKFFQSSIVPQKLVTYFTVERLESACYACAAFLRAHRLARQKLHEFIDSDISAIVVRESELEDQEARIFLENVRDTFPQVLRVVKTRQVAYSVLNCLLDYVHNLGKVGLLEEKETLHLHDSVRADLKKFLRYPPLVKVPKIQDMLTSNPFLSSLPSTVCGPLTGSTPAIVKLSGETLYREGSKSAGIWLISHGIVKWSSKSISNRQLLSTFSHGRTLGLYEVLSERPYICDVITSSVVVCFFIETEKVRAALKSNPEVEEVFWRESVVLAKFMLPSIFEEMSMQEFRILIAERSTMNIYRRDESFELVQPSVGILLEGIIKVRGGQEDLLTAPAALLPCDDQSFRHSEICEAQVQLYQVEARARVIVFDTTGFVPGRSQVSHSTGTEHGDLMSWPKHFLDSRRHDPEVGGQENNWFTRQGS